MLRFILKLIDSIVWPLVITVGIWLVFFMNFSSSFNYNSLGMRPMDLRGILGIFTMPFLHANFDHLFSNTVPLILSMGFIFIYFDKHKFSILFWNLIITGALLLFIGQEGSIHIGASGLVYAYIFFLVTQAFLTKNKEMLAASFVLIFLYGSLIYGLFPEYGRLIGKNISWEGHLSGAISGIVTGFIYRKRGPQKQMFFEDEDDEEDDDEFAYWKRPQQENLTEDSRPIRIHYHYKKKENNPDA